MNLVARLIEEVNKNRKTIVVAGDVMIDLWVHGHIESCQEGCNKFVRESMVETPGGAGNARTCLHNWNVVVRLFGQKYTDRPKKWRFINEEGSIVFRYDNENLLLSENQYKPMYCDMIKTIEDANGVLISDYDKGFLTPDVIKQIIEACNQHGIPCVADCKREPSLYHKSILKVNSDYAKRFRLPISDKAVITCGGNCPIIAFEEIGRQKNSVRCINHVGAGDCFAAHLILALAYGFSLKDAAIIAHSAGRVYVQYPHNRSPFPREIEDDLEFSS